MKTITQLITERLQLNKDRVHKIKKIKYEYFPETKEELMNIIDKITKNHKDNKIIDLNMIDTSKITDMSDLFMFFCLYNYDISQWDVSNVEDMSWMFNISNFNNDISQWDVSNVTNMVGMFKESEFNQNISQWNTISCKDMSFMFTNSKFNQNISQWDVSNVEDMSGMFAYSDFNQDISQWNISKVNSFINIFKNNNAFNQDLTPWKNKLKNKHLLRHIKKYVK